MLRCEANRLAGNDLAARRDLERAVRADPRQPWPYLCLAAMLLHRQCTKEALHMLITYLALVERPELSRIRERAHHVLQYFNTAICNLWQAVKVKATVENLCELAQALHVAGDAAAAQVRTTLPHNLQSTLSTLSTLSTQQRDV